MIGQNTAHSRIAVGNRDGDNKIEYLGGRYAGHFVAVEQRRSDGTWETVETYYLLYNAPVATIRVDRCGRTWITPDYVGTQVHAVYDMIEGANLTEKRAE